VRVLVLGDLVLDVVLQAAQPIQSSTDVPGRVEIRQGGSAANAARWLARLGVRSQLVCAIGRDGAGRSLVAQLRRDSVEVRAVRIAGHRTGRIGVLVAPSGERSFVADRRAATRMTPDDLKAEWFDGIQLIHLPAYSLLEELGPAGLAATRLAHGAGSLVTIDVSSTAPLLAEGRRSALAVIEAAAPDLLFATGNEARALLGARRDDALLEVAPIAVVKRGRKGATVLARDGRRSLRFEVATTSIRAADTTGAGDAFSAGFLHGWLDGRRKGLTQSAALQRGALAGNRAALRHISSPLPELPLG